MQCLTPMIRKYQKFSPEVEKENGIRLQKTGIETKPKQYISGNFETEAIFRKDPNLLRHIQEVNKENLKELEKLGVIWQYQAIPCKHCWACSMNYSAEWALRIMKEAEQYEHNYFITLTYNEEHLPIATKLHYKGQTYENDGTWLNGTLNPEDITRFIKAMRKEYEELHHFGIKYYLCGEYGGETHRPHYHLIVMNCPLDMSQFYDCHVDKKFFKAHWKSHQVEKWWSEPRKKGEEPINLGMVDIAEVEWSSAAYVARYTAKKAFKDYTPQMYYQAGMVPEFVRMSRRPGIGSAYYEKNKHIIYQHDEIIAKTVKNNTATLKPPKAWDKKFKEQFPEEWEKIRISREHAKERADKLKQELTNYTDKEMLKIKAESLLTKAEMLPRGL